MRIGVRVLLCFRVLLCLMIMNESVGVKVMVVIRGVTRWRAT